MTRRRRPALRRQSAFGRAVSLATGHPVPVLICTLLFVVVAGVVGAGVPGQLRSGGFEDPSSESARAARTLKHVFNLREPNLLLSVSTPNGVDARPAARAGRRLTERLALEPDVTGVVSYWTTIHKEKRFFVSRDRKHALVIARVTGSDKRVSSRAKDLARAFGGRWRGLTIHVGGPAPIVNDIGDQANADLRSAERLAIPISLIVLVFVYRGLVAALLPLAIGLLAIVGTLLVLRVLTLAMPVSVFALNLATGMGLGLAIDYSLLVVSRFREEVRRGFDVRTAVATTMRTAGRTVTFSAITIALSLAATLIFPMSFLRSIAYSGIAVTALAAVGAVFVLPAALVLLGRRVDALSLRRTPRAGRERSGGWYRFARLVMRRPVLFALISAALLLALASPFRHASFGLADDRSLPPGKGSQQAGDLLRGQFRAPALESLYVVQSSVERATRRARKSLTAYEHRLSRVRGVVALDEFGTPAWRIVLVHTAVEPLSHAGERLVKAVRNARPPFPMEVGGPAAEFADLKHGVGARLPLLAGLVALSAFVLIFALTGSVVLPLKALLMNALSLGAVFGALVYVFQEGHLQWLVGGFRVTGLLDILAPVVLFAIAFGLSTDYGVFVLSRIKEEHDATGDNQESVALGLARTGPVVTAAALLISIALIAIGTSRVTTVKLIGMGAALAVIVDATLVRSVLVPSLMRILGSANWWAPRPLRNLHERIARSTRE